MNFLSFFVVNDKLYKVVKENKKYVYVFRGIKNELEDEIMEIGYRNNSLFYYTRNGTVCYYYRFNENKSEDEKSEDENERKVRVDKITCINENVVGTGDGNVFLMDENKLVNVFDLPITGCDVFEGCVYFCSFDGIVGRKKLRKRRIWIWIVVFDC